MASKIWSEIESTVRDAQSLTSLTNEGKVPANSNAAFLQSEVDYIRAHSDNPDEALKNIKNDKKMLESMESTSNEGKIIRGGAASQVQSLVDGAKARAKEDVVEQVPAAAIVVEETVSTTVGNQTVTDKTTTTASTII